MDKPKKILVIRNDRLGDFMLAYPTFNVLKKLFPTSRIYALVPEYTKPMAELCQWIDEIVVDDATITSHIKRIRKKFVQADSGFDCIDTVYGMGYRWKS